MQTQYPTRDSYKYDDDSLFLRARQRAIELQKFVRNAPTTKFATLELGCWDGLVSSQLQDLGYSATAIDARDEGFHPKCRSNGTRLHKMDAARMAFEDKAFDLAFSYDAFEHFADPRAVISEIIRVTKPGGWIFLNFGPLFAAPWGLHAYRTVTTPYCQHLFPKAVLNEFTEKRGLAGIDFSHVNGWSLSQFRRLWSEFSDELERLEYREFADCNHLGLISRYPNCFRGKADSFEEFVVSSIDVLFRRRVKAHP